MRARRRSELNKAVELLGELRAVEPYMQLQTWAVLFEVAHRPGIAMQELAEKLGMAQSTCSRNVALLSERASRFKRGLGLVETRLDPFDHRRKVVRLTASGEQKVAALAGIAG